MRPLAWSRLCTVLCSVLATASIALGCGGATFKFVETPWSGAPDNVTRLKQGAEKLGCSGKVDETGELEVQCPEGKLSPDQDAGSLRVGPSLEVESNMLAMCNDGLAENCPAALERFWAAGAP